MRGQCSCPSPGWLTERSALAVKFEQHGHDSGTSLENTRPDFEPEFSRFRRHSIETCLNLRRVRRTFFLSGENFPDPVFEDNNGDPDQCRGDDRRR